jgi:hypothetical protein
MKYLVFVLFFYSLLASGESAEECAQMARTDDRLACFDQLFPSESDSKNQTEILEEQVVAPTAVKMEGREKMTDKGSMASAEANNSRDALLKNKKTPEADKEATGFSLKKIFTRDTQHDLTTTIKALKAGNSQKMVFLLANDEIWLQNVPRTLPFRKGDTVTLKSGLFGGFIMQSDSGTSTRVSRIQ